MNHTYTYTYYWSIDDINKVAMSMESDFLSRAAHMTERTRKEMQRRITILYAAIALCGERVYE